MKSVPRRWPRAGKRTRPGPGRAEAVSRAEVARKALARATQHLGMNQAQLARVIGVSESTVARMFAGRADLDVDGKDGELALLLLRVFRSLDAVVGGDATALKAWFQAENEHLGGVPAKLVERAEGLVRVAEYLDGVRGTL